MSLRSWLPAANDGRTDFPIQNLPYGVFEVPAGAATAGEASIGVAIGDRILDLRACAEAGLLHPDLVPACSSASLNALMALGPRHWSALRRRVTALLAEDSREQAAVEPCLVPMNGVVMRLPAAIGDYSDFFASLDHATNAGSLFRPGEPLYPNYKYVPIGYHGRASSIVISGTPVRRPAGQTAGRNFGALFNATRALDYEMEVGAFVGPGNRWGEPVPIGEAASHIFGLCLLNDWSARDIQAWESQPLGPFLAKSFATSLSPWVVPMEALEPFRVPAFSRAEGDPAPMPYLYSKDEQERGGIDITVEVWLVTRRMREAGSAPVRLSRGYFRDLYWTVAQLLTHQTSNGCNLRPGDLLGSGTISNTASGTGTVPVSGTAPESRGCLLEITKKGREPIVLPNGEQRRFLEDGDEVILRGYCEREGQVRIGFGECRGIVG
jgi:fumarylacetoacetase